MLEGSNILFEPSMDTLLSILTKQKRMILNENT
jgi:hypothetical protein